MARPDHIWLLDCVRPEEVRIGEKLVNWLRKKEIKTTLFPCAGRHEVLSALEEIRLQQEKAPVENPVLQFVCHGSKHGLRFPDGTGISWEDLRGCFRRIFLASRRRLLVSMGSCHGFSIARLICKHEPCPYSHLCGTRRELGARDCIDGYVVFYRALIEGATVEQAAARVDLEIPPFEMLAYDIEKLWHIAASRYGRDYLNEAAIVGMRQHALARHEAAIAQYPELRERIERRYTAESLRERLQKWHDDFFA